MRPEPKITDSNLSSAVLTTTLCKDKHDSNQNRLKDSELKTLGSHENSTASEKQDKHLSFLSPFLELLPDKQLHPPAKDLASHILSSVIDKK